MRSTGLFRTATITLTYAVLALCILSCGGTRHVITTASGLTYWTVERGSGPPAKPVRHVMIHETTSLADGTLIYSTHTNNQPLKFLLGGNQVIEGVDEGVRCMQVGERRKLIVPPSLSRRATYSEGLSPDDTLYYDIELLAILEE